MKLKDKQVIKTSSLQELGNLLGKMRDELFLLKLDKTQNKLKNTRSIFQKRKEIALVLTLIQEFKLMPKQKEKIQ